MSGGPGGPSLERMASIATKERALFADALAEAGPDAPTLCTGWTARDLAAHVILRERRPDAALGIAFGPLAGHTRSVQESLAAKPFDELVGLVRRRSRLLIDPVDDVFNATEFFVHLEDVRRARPGWQPRPADGHLEASMWRILRTRGLAFFRRSTVGVVLERPDGSRHVAKEGEPSVTLVGPATELTLYAYGRTGHALVEVRGEPGAVADFEGTPLDI